MALLRILFITVSLFSPLQLFAEEAGFCGETAAENQKYDSQTAASMTKIINAATSVQKTIGASVTLPAAQDLKSQVDSCGTKKSAADWACVETCSPSIKSFSDEWGGAVNLAAMIGNSGMIGDQCSSIARAISTAQQALTLFQAACGTGKAICTSSCTSIKAKVTKVSDGTSKDVQTAQNKENATCALDATGVECQNAKMDTKLTIEAMKLIANELGVINTQSGEALAKCNTYEKTRNNAMAGTMMALQGVVAAKKCKEQNANSAIANQDCTTTTSPTYSTPSCQCVRGEKTAAECQNININASSIKPSGISVTPVSTTDGTKGGLNAGDLGDGGDNGFKSAASTGAGGAPPPEGGGGGGLGGGGSGGGGLGQDGAGGARKLNANILGGGFGGGGGGGGGAGPGYGEVDSKLKAYMPGGAKDPNRTIASQLAKEVTPEAGRSNWEKIRLRYRDNYSSLINSVGK